MAKAFVPVKIIGSSTTSVVLQANDSLHVSEMKSALASAIPGKLSPSLLRLLYAGRLLEDCLSLEEVYAKVNILNYNATFFFMTAVVVWTFFQLLCCSLSADGNPCFVRF